MRKLFLLLLMVSFISPALAKNEVKQAAKSVDRILDDDKGGRPNNPGAHGRANAEYKKATNPGQGHGKNKSHGGTLLDEMIDDDDRKGGKDGKKDKDGKKGGKKKYK